MIDTLVIYIYDLERHKTLVDYLESPTRKDYTIGDAFESNSIFKTEKRQGQYVQNSGLRLTKKYTRGKLLLPSWHYDLAYTIHQHKDCIEFNFSLTKFFLQTNVLQLVRFSRYSSTTLHDVANLAYTDLQALIQRSFAIAGIHDSIDYSKLCIHQIDLSWNQVFDNEKFATEYFHLQRQIKPPYARKKPIQYGTSIMHVSTNYSFEIYLKGIEFQKHDRQQLIKLLSSGKLTYDIEKLQELANRTVRYELKCRNGIISELYNKRALNQSSLKTFFNGAKQYQRYCFNQVVLPENLHLKTFKNAFKYYQKILDSTLKFAPFYHINIFDYITSVINNQPFDKVNFDNTLFLELFELFNTYIQHYQITRLPQRSYILELVNNHNINVSQRIIRGKKIRPNTLIQYLDALSKYGSKESIITDNIYSRMQVHRLEKMLLKLGVDTKNAYSPISYNPPSGFYHYYNFCVKNNLPITF